jgi:hypothetical protein
MKTLWTALFLLTLQFSAQENEVYADGVFNLKKIKPENIYRLDKSQKRSGVNAQILDSLQTNQQIMILKKEESIPVLQLGERRANWYKISYQKGDTFRRLYLGRQPLCRLP